MFILRLIQATWAIIRLSFDREFQEEMEYEIKQEEYEREYGLKYP